MYATQHQARSVALEQTSELRLSIMMKSGCISSPPVVRVTGVLSDPKMIGTCVAPTGRWS